MKTFLRSERLAGLLFLLPLLAYGTGHFLIVSLYQDPLHWQLLPEGRPRLVSGSLLLLANSILVIGIAAVLYPSIRRYSQRVAIAYLSARLMEGLILVTGLAGVLLLPSLAGMQHRAPEAAELLYDAIGKLQQQTYQIAMIVLGLGSLLFCRLLLQQKLIPFRLSLMGLLGYVLLILGAIGELFGYSVGVLLSLPGGLFELAFAIRLMAKGLNHKNLLRDREALRSAAS